MTNWPKSVCNWPKSVVLSTIMCTISQPVSRTHIIFQSMFPKSGCFAQKSHVLLGDRDTRFRCRQKSTQHRRHVREQYSRTDARTTFRCRPYNVDSRTSCNAVSCRKDVPYHRTKHVQKLCRFPTPTTRLSSLYSAR